MLPDTIRLTQREKEMLSRVKRDTGIKNWNVLCRWALCLSLAEQTVPPRADLGEESNVEMSAKVFAGADLPVINSLLAMRAEADGEDDVEAMFRTHLGRGIGYLFGSSQLRARDGLLQAAAAATVSSD